jgi:hypothetical protein
MSSTAVAAAAATAAAKLAYVWKCFDGIEPNDLINLLIKALFLSVHM